MFLKVIICIIIAYALGNINFATIISTKLKKNDIRNFGSGNAGTTNMIRVFGKRIGLVTFMGDLLKGIAAVIIARLIGGKVQGEVCAAIGALFVVIGHVWPVLYGFRGGKGAATSFGVMIAISLPISLIGGVLAAIALAITKKMSVGSLLGAIAATIASLFISPWFVKLLMIGLCLILFFTHRGNIQRLLNGTENPTFTSKESRNLK